MKTILLPLLLIGAVQAKPPAWDGKETVEDYARRAGLKAAETLDLGDGIKLDLILIPAGSFVMGSPDGEAQGEDKGKEKQHKVTLTHAFYLGKFEVTQPQYQKVTGSNPSAMKGDTLPVTNATWDDATAFCKKLGALVKRDVRLPTEAQWEYACRAGTKTAYYTGDTTADLAKAGWFGGNSARKIHPVGELARNAWGLYDMHGNVREYCQDWLADFTGKDEVDPAGPEKGEKRVVRGGAFTSNPNVSRAAVRRPIESLALIGMRVVVMP
jgi:formylglycine-generating enzyme required for sulfatase activity